MKLSSLARFALPTAAAAGAVLLMTPRTSVGWNLLGFSLPQTFRSVRVFNNFTDVTANNNQTADANFPGALGATLAIWKGCAEWNAGPHNLNGNGDPSQPGGLGSGGSNFEISWQGEANQVGDVDEMTHSEISGSNGGVLAYTEGPSGGPDDTGWRIRYYSGWTWEDGPTTSMPNQNVDLQGVACHEYGHALGMAHSGSNGATMYPSITGTGTSQRSLAQDDIDGIQQIYFAEDTAVKPKILSLSGPGPSITLTGVNFAATGNEVWFTQADPALNTAAVKVTNVSSTSNGTSMTITVPGGAGPGEIQVKKGGVNGPKGLSNSLAIVPVPGQTCSGNIVNYCTPGVTTNFCAATMSSTGAPSASAGSGFVLICSFMEGQKSGLIFYGVNGRLANVWSPGSASYLCVKTPVQRTPSVNSGGTTNQCDGTISIDWNAYIQSHPGALGTPFTGGEVIDAQCWFRDPPAPGTTNLSNGIEFTLCP